MAATPGRSLLFPLPEYGLHTLYMAFPLSTPRPCGVPSPVLLEAVGGRYNPAVSDESPPTDVSTPNLEAGLPWPLTLRGHDSAHNAAGGALEATV